MLKLILFVCQNQYGILIDLLLNIDAQDAEACLEWYIFFLVDDSSEP